MKHAYHIFNVTFCNAQTVKYVQTTTHIRHGRGHFKLLLSVLDAGRRQYTYEHVNLIVMYFNRTSIKK